MANKPRRKLTKEQFKKKRDEIAGQIRGLMEERPGFYGENNKEVFEYLRRKLCLDCSNGFIRAALYSLVNKEEIKRLSCDQDAETPKSKDRGRGVIFLKEGVPFEDFPPEFQAFVREKRPEILAV
ncbi:hypothetical protein HY004_00905 [Candidatus Saccharibacteria bacterium]|nr:hypothetical protein [Candidatus Saccharibacteria bacterium]